MILNCPYALQAFATERAEVEHAGPVGRRPPTVQIARPVAGFVRRSFARQYAGLRRADACSRNDRGFCGLLAADRNVRSGTAKSDCPGCDGGEPFANGAGICRTSWR